MKRDRRSSTSDWVAAARAIYSGAGEDLRIADDPFARSLLGPGLAATVALLGGTPIRAALTHRMLSLVTRGLVASIPLRTRAIDEVVRAGVRDGHAQLVVLGAGLDARAWRLAELADTAVFELDHPATQAHKRERAVSFPRRARAVHFCAIDFERQTIGEVLRAAGFAPAARSTWIWEGVTMYLTHAAIDASLDAIAKASAPGSRVAITYVPPDFGEPWEQRLADAIARVIREELVGYVAPADLARRLADRGLRVESDEAGPDWAARFWPSAEVRRVRAIERLVVAVKE